VLRFKNLRFTSYYERNENQKFRRPGEVGKSPSIIILVGLLFENPLFISSKKTDITMISQKRSGGLSHWDIIYSRQSTFSILDDICVELSIKRFVLC
jgi:hypothetical protein